MNLKLMLYGASTQAGVLTGIRQTSRGSPSVVCFLNSYFRISANEILAPQSWDTALMDILLGARMYGIRSRGEASLNIAVFPGPGEGEVRYAMLDRTIRRMRKNRSNVHIALRQKPQNSEETAFYSRIV